MSYSGAYLAVLHICSDLTSISADERELTDL